MRNKIHPIQKGFTLVELAVIIAVIAILVTISAVGWNVWQADARDSERAADTLLIGEALERYYQQNGEYPSCATLSDNPRTVTQEVLQNLPENALRAPGAAESAVTSIICSDLNDSDAYAYLGDSSSACTSGVACLGWVIRYREERTGEVVERYSRHNSDMAGTIPDDEPPAPELSITVIPGNTLHSFAFGSAAGTERVQTVTLTNTSNVSASITMELLAAQNTTRQGMFRARVEAERRSGDYLSIWNDDPGQTQAAQMQFPDARLEPGEQRSIRIRSVAASALPSTPSYPDACGFQWTRQFRIVADHPDTSSVTRTINKTLRVEEWQFADARQCSGGGGPILH